MSIMYLIGRHQHLFLENDANGCLIQHTGKANITTDYLRELSCLHRERRDILNRHGIRYYHIVVPNKETALRTFLPKHIIYEENGATPFRLYFESQKYISEFSFFNPWLVASESEPYRFYPRDDSHWNQRAAILYFRNAIGVLGIYDTIRQGFLSYVTSSKSVIGDLGVHAKRNSEIIEEVKSFPCNYTLSGEGNIVNEGYFRHYKNCNPIVDERIMIIHDSFTHALYDTIANTWREALTLHTPDLDIDFSRSFRPDVVVFIQVERFFPRLPRNDIDFVGMTSQLSQEKDVTDVTSRYFVNLANAGR